MRVSLHFLAASALLVFSTPVLGFGADGHEAICEIAYRDLTPAAKANVDALMALETDGRIKSFRDSCVWPNFSETATNRRRSEHYINVPRTWQAIPELRCAEPCFRPTLFVVVLTHTPISRTVRSSTIRGRGYDEF